jgi:hypothetical protein
MSAVHSDPEERGAPRARRGFLAEMAAAVPALLLLPWSRKAAAQAVYYDQYGQPVNVAPGAVVTPAPAGTVPAPGSAYYGPAGVVGQSRRVARRTSRRTGRREDVREDVRDEIYD